MADPVSALKEKFWPPKQVTTSFSGKTVIVTGANSGVGLATALKYVELDASTVILAVRSKDKGTTAKEQIEASTGRKDVMQVWELDMESFESVDAFAKRVDSELERVDVVVLNAGLITKDFALSKTGWEVMLQVNTISTLLLAILLMPKLKASHTVSSPAHLTVVASTGSLLVELTPTEKGQLLQTYNKPQNLNRLQSHLSTKLFMMWMTRELAKRCVKADGEPTVIINDTCPGGCRSNMTREFNSTLMVIGISIASVLMFRPAENGARNIVAATLLGKESQGLWWKEDRFMTPSKYITSDEGKEMSADMWTEIIAELKEKVPRVELILASLP